MSKHKHNYNKIAQLLLVGLMSTTLYNTSFSATKEIKLAEPPAYQSAWAKEGCSQDAWNQLSEEYKAKNNEFEAINKVIGQNHINQTLTADSLFQTCFGSMKGQAKEIINTAEGILKKDKFTIGGLLGMLTDWGTNALNGLVNQALDGACKSVNDKFDSILEKSGVKNALGTANSFTTDPAGAISNHVNFNGVNFNSSNTKYVDVGDIFSQANSKLSGAGKTAVVPNSSGTTTSPPSSGTGNSGYNPFSK